MGLFKKKDGEYYYDRYFKNSYAADNPREAFQALEMAAKLNHRMSCYLLGRAYLYGNLGNPVDYGRARELFCRAYELGYIYFGDDFLYLWKVAGYSGEPPYTEISKCNSRGEKEKNYLRYMENKNTDPGLADYYLLRAAQEGSIAARERCAGKCAAARDYNQAIMWQQRAINIGAAELENCAYHTLGRYYTSAGERKKAYEAYKKGADLCEPKSLMEMAGYYSEGLYFEKDENRAAHYEMLAGDNGDYEAALRVAGYFEKGLKGFAKDPGKAFEYYQKSFENLDSYKYNYLASYNLGRCYLYGIGVQADVQKGLKMLEEANCPEAWCILALYYGKMNVAQALKWAKVIGWGFKFKEIYPQLDDLFKKYNEEKKYEERLPDDQHKMLEDTESISVRLKNAIWFMWKYSENFADTNLIKYQWCYRAIEAGFSDAAERMDQLYELLFNDMTEQVQRELQVHEEMKRNYFNPGYYSKAEPGLEWLLRVKQNAAVNFYLGMIHNNKGKFEEALDCFRAAMKSPDRDKYVDENGKSLIGVTKKALETTRKNLKNKMDLEYDIAVLRKDIDDFIEWLEEEA